MAKRYIKITPFYDRPSTAGPVSAARLNAMNDALDACDTELENKFAAANIVQTTAAANTDKVPSAAVTKSLQDQITAQNDNLAQLFTVPAGASIVLQCYENSLYLFHTAFALVAARTFCIVIGGNGGQANTGQPATINNIITGSLISYAVSTVVGKLNQITITNSGAYAVTLVVTTLSGYRTLKL
ncbi:MAG: hypothetical protein K0R34_2168 [Herbinix sp.]|jgi:hypothetical protein|nr:hypothetical protein [Herbinix sp.]